MRKERKKQVQMEQGLGGAESRKNRGAQGGIRHAQP